MEDVGGDPKAVFYNEKGDEIETIQLADMSTVEIEKLFKEKGFKAPALGDHDNAQDEL